MSEVKRFFPELAFHVMSENCKAYSAVMTESDSGGWVEGHEYDHMRARVAELEATLANREAVPEPLVPLGFTSSALAYVRGWNDCREAILAAAKSQEGK